MVEKKIIVLVLNEEGVYEEKILSPYIKENIFLLMEGKPIIEKKNFVRDYEWEKLRSENKTNENLQSLLASNPELEVYKNYFAKKVKNNAYIIIMKQQLIHYMSTIKKHDSKMSLDVMAKILNISHGAVVKHKNMSSQSKHPDYNEVIVIMDKMIKDDYYPIGKINWNLRKTEYTWEKIKHTS